MSAVWKTSPAKVNGNLKMKKKENSCDYLKTVSYSVKKEES